MPPVPPPDPVPEPNLSPVDERTEIEVAARAFAAGLSDEPIQTEILRRLREQCETGSASGFARIEVVDTTADLPDLAQVQLAVLHPRHLHDPADVHGSLADPIATSPAAEQTLRLTGQVGDRPRRHRNAVVALAGDAHHYPMLAEQVREYLAWSHVSVHADELGLPTGSAQEARIWLEATAHDLQTLLSATWFWILVPTQDSENEPVRVRVLTAEGPGADLGERVATTLRAENELLTSRDDHAIRRDLDGPLTARWRRGHIGLGELWQLYTSMPSLPRLRDRSVLEAGLAGAVADELDWQYQGFALAEGYDPGGAGYLDLHLPGDDRPTRPLHESTLVVRPDRAVEQRHRTTSEQSLPQLRPLEHLGIDGPRDPAPPPPRPTAGKPLTAQDILQAGTGRDDQGRPTAGRRRTEHGTGR